MFTKEEVQSYLDQNRHQWGQSATGDTRSLWDTPDSEITPRQVLREGTGHSCVVIQNVSTRKSLPAMWRSYKGKNTYFSDISRLCFSTGRPDLARAWNTQEIKSRSHQMHPQVKANAQFPEGHHHRTLTANARMVQYDLADHFKALDHIAHGAMPEYAQSPVDCDKFSLPLDNYSECVLNARNLDHLCALVAVQTARTLQDRGVAIPVIAKLLSQNFAQTGIIREHGQQKHAARLVDLILKEIKQDGRLSGLAAEFRHQARPKVETFYHGRRNPQLNPNR